MLNGRWLFGRFQARMGEIECVQMRFLKRLFRPQNKPAPPHVPSGAEKDAARKYWEAERAADRKRRGATDKRP